MLYAGRLVIVRAGQWFSEVYSFREVLFHLLARDLKLKYKRTALGYLWSLLNPILQLVLLGTVFSHVVRWQIKDYTLFLFSGLLVWNFFSTALISGAYAYLENEHFIRKIYLPKLMFPLSKVLFRLVDFLFSLLALSMLGWVLGYSLRPTMIWLPPAVLLLFFFVLGLSVVAAVLTAYFRDVQYLIQVGLQMLYFASPILYSIDIMPVHLQWVLRANPLCAFLLLFQEIIYVGQVPTLQQWGFAAGMTLLSMATGCLVLLYTEHKLVFRL